MTYECTKRIFIDEYDEDLSWTGKQKTIREGSEWTLCDEVNWLAGDNGVHLVSKSYDEDGKDHWVEVCHDTLKQHFKIIEENRKED